jgi:hypothetical protein
MTALAWDKIGTRLYETGVDRGVLYIPNGAGVYDSGFAWSGLTTVTESPSGAEATPTYADNIKYLNLISVEQFGATVEAYTYPDEFAQCDGSAQPEPGLALGQQPRKLFGMCYRTRVGNDLVNTEYGYKLHIIWGALAAPSEKAYASINDSPEAITFSWAISTTPVDVGTIGGTAYKPTASMTIDSTVVDPTALAALEVVLYGTVGVDPVLPTPAAIVAMFAGSLTLATPTAPTYNSSTKVITIPAITGVEYFMDGVLLSSGAQAAIAADKIVVAHPATGYKFPAIIDNDWFFDF